MISELRPDISDADSEVLQFFLLMAKKILHTGQCSAKITSLVEYQARDMSIKVSRLGVDGYRQLAR